MNSIKNNFVENLTEATKILENRKLIETYSNEYPVAIIGDIHGFMESLNNFEKIADNYSARKLIFLGDYVDRGYEGVEVLIELTDLLINEKDKIILLRGNHEDLEMNENYGFYTELISKIGPDGINAIKDFYSNLPLSAFIDNTFFVHGGIPCLDCKNKEYAIDLFNYFSTINNIKGKNDYLEFKDKVIMQMVWNDPDGLIDWFEPNYIRGDGIFYYGKKAWKKFIEKNKANLIIRGHEVVDGFHVWKPDGTFMTKIKNHERLYLDQLMDSVITVFSSRYHIGRSGAIILYKDELEFVEI